MLASSSNHLNGLLPDEYVDLQDNAALSVPETASTLNILLHVLYNISCARYQPSFACLSDTTAVLRKYGLKPASVLARGQPLYNALLFIAPLNPIETYALAASEGLEDLAVAVSSYTLGMKPYDHLTPELVEAMGALYLHRLMNLHGKRLDGLRELLEAKIFSHAATPHCSAMDQQVVSKAFELAAAQIFYDATPGMCFDYICGKRHLVENTFQPSHKPRLRPSSTGSSKASGVQTVNRQSKPRLIR